MQCLHSSKINDYLARYLLLQIGCFATPRQPGATRVTIRVPSLENLSFVCGDWDHLGPDATAVRGEVFVRELGIPKEDELDEADALSLHVVAYAAEGTPVGTGRLLPTGFIGRMAAIHLARRKGVGGHMLELLTAEARRAGHEYAFLNAQIHATAFYLRHGYTQLGEEFLEAGIRHILMRRRL